MKRLWSVDVLKCPRCLTLHCEPSCFTYPQLNTWSLGAVAMMVHGLVRGTEDLDVFVRPSAGNIERLRVALRPVYPSEGSIYEVSVADLLGENPVVRCNAPDGSFESIS